MIVFKIFTQYFWAIAIIVTCLNVLFFKGRSRSVIAEDPKALQEFKKLMRGYLFWMNLPWIVMGIGCTIGGVPTVFHYLRPRDGNPFVIAWWVIVFIEYILSIYWIFLCKGAEKFAKFTMHNCSFCNRNISSPTMIKLMFLLCLSGGLIAAIAMWTTDITLPSFPTGH
jgi:hypothetical protein